MSTPPIVKIYRNPWSETIPDSVLLRFVLTAAVEAQQRLTIAIADGLVAKDKTSFGAVLLDPTRPRSAVTLQDRILATIEIGPFGANYLPNAAAKADAHDRHGISNGHLVETANHCLGNGDFAWGYSASHSRAICAGSGLSADQDHDWAFEIVKAVMDFVALARSMWLRDRRAEGSQGWYNPDDLPGAEYSAILNLEPLLANVDA